MLSKIDTIKEQYPDTLIMDEFDDCVIGICLRFGQEPIVAYDMNLVIAKLMEDDMSEEEAVEYFEYNQIGAWVGDMTPCFIDTLEE